MGRAAAKSWDNQWITKMLDQQFEMASVFDKRDILDLLVADAFNLGYAFGFAEKACDYFLAKHGADARDAYVLKTLSDLTGDDSAGETLFLFAQRQRKHPGFQRGYLTASRNVKHWLAASGGTTPIDLSDHLIKTSWVA